MRTSQISMKENKPILAEPIDLTLKSLALIIVPISLRRKIFTCFHANPLGGHFSAFQTFHQIRLRFFWPGMYKYIQRLISSCMGCIMKNTISRPSSELLYTFSLDEPMVTIHCDLYQPEKTIGFDGDHSEMIVCCHMKTFGASESVRDLSSTGFDKAVHTIMLRFGLAKLIVTDSDSKFHGMFQEMCSILNIKHHFSSKGKDSTDF